MPCQSSAHGVISRTGPGWEEQEAAYALGPAESSLKQRRWIESNRECIFNLEYRYYFSIYWKEKENQWKVCLWGQFQQRISGKRKTKKNAYHFAKTRVVNVL